MWKNIGHQPVGGLREVGFIEDTDYLMVLGYGRTIFNCLTNEKTARDRQDYYQEKWDWNTGIIEGFDLFDNKEIICGGFEYPDPISKETDEHWTIVIKNERRPNYKEELKNAEVMYLYHTTTKEEIEVEVFHYQITRAYGFSKTGKSFIIAHSHGVDFWVKKVDHNG